MTRLVSHEVSSSGLRVGLLKFNLQTWIFIDAAKSLIERVDYRTNIDNYPKWQVWMREKQPRLLVIWGKYESSFDPSEPESYRRDVPNAEVHIVDYAAIFLKFAGAPASVTLFTQMSQAVHGLVSQPVFRLGSGAFESEIQVLTCLREILNSGTWPVQLPRTADVIEVRGRLPMPVTAPAATKGIRLV